MNTVIEIENLSKKYRLGAINHGVLFRDLQSLWARMRGKEDPHAKVLESAKQTSGDFWALKDISFSITQGEVLGIIGRNGAGKSTLLKILSRVTSPTSGHVKIKGRIASLLEVGTGFHPELTGRENIFLNGAILGMTKSEVNKKFDEIVDFSGVEKFIDTPVKRYSSGMYVRLAFAVAANLESEILVVDEVLAVGDTEFQKKCLGKMGEVSKQFGKTVLFVSHNLSSMQQLCNRGILLANGRLNFSGQIAETIEKYSSLSTHLPGHKNAGEISLEFQRESPMVRKVFHRIRFYDRQNKIRQTFASLDYMKIEVDLIDTQDFSYMDYGIKITTPLGQIITSFATWMQKDKVANPTMLRLELDSIKFAAGTYNVSLSMTHPKEGIYIDRIDNAAQFHIEAIDLFDTGRDFTADYGLVIPEGNFVVT